MCELFPFFISPPCNDPLPGEYNFTLALSNEKPVSKATTFTYSSLTKRAYIKQDMIIGMLFTFSSLPPATSLIRASAVHKTPELIGDNVVCCPKHTEEQKKNGDHYCQHFIRGAAKCQTSYHEDPISGRLSITMLIGSLQQKSDTHLQAFYMFPCYTSDLKKGVGRLIQLIFTLENSGKVIGRAVVDARICASPGRDRDIDEAKLQPHTPSPLSPYSHLSSPLGDYGKKRPSEIFLDYEASLPASKVLCLSSTHQRVSHTIEIYPELIPFINTTAAMLERVYFMQPDACSPPAAPDDREFMSAQEPCDGTFTDLYSWMEHLQLTHYHHLLESHGLHSLSQVAELTEEDLQQIGITKPKDCQRFINGYKLINSSVFTNVSEERTSKLS